MAYTRATTDATTLKDFAGGNGGLNGDIVLTFDAAAVAIVKGQFLMLSSGYVTPCTATTDQPVGVAAASVDNSAGSAGDLQVPVIVRGIAQVNAFVAASSTYDDALVPFSSCGLSTDGTTPGQSVSCGADPTIAVGTMLSTAAVPTASATYNALVYIDFLGQHGAI
jgi:hypothetical protein